MAPLPNTLAGLHQLRETPSQADGVPADLEEELRVYGCQLIQQAGILLQLPQVAMATAQVLFQRFWFVSSMKHFSIKDICMGALYLACKLEEQSIRGRNLINVFDFLVQRAVHIAERNPGPRSLELAGLVEVGDVHAMRRRLSSILLPRSEGAHAGPSFSLSPKKRSNGSSAESQQRLGRDEYSTSFVYTPPSYFTQDFYDTKDALVVAEMQILKRLGFQAQVNLPFATLVNYLKLLGLTEDASADAEGASSTTAVDEGGAFADGRPKAQAATPSFAQRAWSYLNDALQTPLYCQFPPHILACGAIYLTALTNKPKPLALPMRPKPWWALFDVEQEEDLRIIGASLLRLYDDSGWDGMGSKMGVDAEREPQKGGLHAMGLAARVRDEWGGLAVLLDRKAVRQWMDRAELVQGRVMR
ncbi:hypothetical protein OC835_002861 [Tilletia horrida]|nr:hypothetical protein OC835_002861 [Tilletia horrida]